VKDFSLVIELFDAEEAARFLSATSIGLLTMVVNGLMSLDEAERLMFTPRTSRVLKGKGISQEFCNLVMNCCELEDVLDLIPLKFEDSVRERIFEFLEFLKKTKAQDPKLEHLDLR